MTETIINLTLPPVTTEIETVLETYPDRPYQQAFAIPHLREELIAYVMSRVSNSYVAGDDNQELSISSKSWPRSEEEKSSLKALIQEGIEHILQQDSELVSHHIPEEVDPGFAPSNWFG